MRVLLVFGTRPEAIKMAPVIKALESDERFQPRVCVTGQHREMLAPMLDCFSIRPDYDLDLMQPGQTLAAGTGKILTELEAVFEDAQPDLLLVQGDTSSAFAAALGAHYRDIDVGHIEAGLRTGNLRAPWPEEANRRLISVLASYHFAPSVSARDNLLREGVEAASIHITGNTIIDALHEVTGRLDADAALRAALDARFDFLNPGKRLVLVTGHRRESMGAGLAAICQAMARLAARDDVQVVWPVHLNPAVKDTVHRLLSGVPDVFLIEPQEYLPFVYLMRRAVLIITDSGGVQEEAPALGIPVLVTRAMTERLESLAAGTARLVSTDSDDLLRHACEVLDDPDRHATMAQIHHPWGSGSATHKILSVLKAYV